MRRSPLALLAQGAVLTALVGGTTAFVSLDKTVTLSVDGQRSEVRSFARTVGDVLDDQGVEVGAHDVVAPAVDAPLEEGATVAVRYGRLLTLTVDGTERQVWVTARTVDEALDQLGLRADGAYLSASRSRRIPRDGAEIELRTPQAVTVVADGERRELTTTAATLRGALDEAGIAVRPQDKVSVDLRTRPADGQAVKVTRIDTRTTAEVRAIAAGTVTRRTSSLYDGERKVERRGRRGVERLTYTETLTDGKRTARELVSREVRREPVDEVVLVGTKARPAPKPARRSSSSGSSGSSSSGSSDGSVATDDGLDWAALARCESGGDPRAVNPIGYYGLYQFSVSTWRSVGGSGMPHEASAAEQTRRAQILYASQGRSPWPHCGRYL